MERVQGPTKWRWFSDQVRLVGAGVEAVDLVVLGTKSPPHRCDALFELGVELSDALEAYQAGAGNETTVREAAVAVAVEAGKIWLSTTGWAREARDDAN